MSNLRTLRFFVGDRGGATFISVLVLMALTRHSRPLQPAAYALCGPEHAESSANCLKARRCAVPPVSAQSCWKPQKALALKRCACAPQVKSDLDNRRQSRLS